MPDQNNQPSPPPLPPCPKCKSSDTKIHTPTAAGSLRIFCRACKRASTIGGKKGGRPTIGDRPFTQKERSQRFHNKKANDDGGGESAEQK